MPPKSYDSLGLLDRLQIPDVAQCKIIKYVSKWKRADAKYIEKKLKKYNKEPCLAIDGG